jgi:hypothetical protein
VRKNLLSFELIRHRGKQEGIKRKLSVALVEPEDHRNPPTPSTESSRKRLPSPALHTARRRLKVSKTESPSHRDAIGTNRVGFGGPERPLGTSPASHRRRPWRHHEPPPCAAPAAVSRSCWKQGLGLDQAYPFGSLKPCRSSRDPRSRLDLGLVKSRPPVLFSTAGKTYPIAF